MILKPFLPWTGGKTKLLNDIDSCIPFAKDDSFTYIEAFLGGGSVLFYMLNNFPHVKRVVVNDLSSDLFNCYEVIRDEVHTLIKQISTLTHIFNSFELGSIERKNLFYAWKTRFNSRQCDRIEQAALFMALCKVCFNGSFRVNKNGDFNTPFHSLKLRLFPYNYDNLINISVKLKDITILNVDFNDLYDYIDSESFCYFDPPYIPISKTSNFTRYTKEGFDNSKQLELKVFCDKLSAKSVKWLQSNSYCDDTIKLYGDYNLKTVEVYRSIARNAKLRGNVKELLISNY